MLNLKNLKLVETQIDPNYSNWLDQPSGLNCDCGKELVNGEVEYIGMCCACDEKMRKEQENQNG